jgi:hypothetical protein
MNQHISTLYLRAERRKEEEEMMVMRLLMAGSWVTYLTLRREKERRREEDEIMVMWLGAVWQITHSSSLPYSKYREDSAMAGSDCLVSLSLS